MPVVVARHFPLPSLQTYVAFCLAVLSSCLFYAFYKCKDTFQPQRSAPQSSAGTSDETDNLTAPNENVHKITPSALIAGSANESQLVCTIMSSDGWAVFFVINFAYCLMFLAGKIIQHVVFGNLRTVERQHLRERFWNFVFYKFVFLFGILNVQAMFTFICWLGWFTVLGLAHIGLQLCFDRFEFVANNPSTPRRVYVKLSGLVMAIFLVAVFLTCASFWAYFTILAGWNLLAFMLAESLMLFIRIAYVVTRIVIHFKDRSTAVNSRWEDKDIVVYYVNLTADLLLYAIDLGNHIHMLLWGNAFLSVTSLIIFLQIRQLYNEFTHRLRRHLAWVQVVRSIDRCLISVSQSCIDPSEQTCSICWETMSSAKRLPCNHLFHATCLRSWLDYDMTCPVCRMSLHKFLIPSAASSHSTGSAGTVNTQPTNEEVASSDNQTNGTNPTAAASAVLDTENRIVRRRFTINASQYISWIPNLSVEVRTTPGLNRYVTTQNDAAGRSAGPPVPSSAASLHGIQLDAMANQVRAVLPQVPMSAIISDLQLTGSAEQTVDNILEGRVDPFTNGSDVVHGMSASSTISEGDGESTEGDDLSSTSCEEEDTIDIPSAADRVHQSHHDPLGLLTLSESSNRQENVSRVFPSNTTPAIGGRFSKDPSERHRLLAIRKLQLVSIAKNQFLSCTSSETRSTSQFTEHSQQPE